MTTETTTPGLSQEQLRELAIMWGRDQLQDPDTLGLHELADEALLQLSDGDITELRQLIGRLQVVLPDPKAAKAYKTVIPSRSPENKGHMTLGTARAAVGLSWGNGRARGGKIYELQDGEWVLLYDVAPGTPKANLPWASK